MRKENLNSQISEKQENLGIKISDEEMLANENSYNLLMQTINYVLADFNNFVESIKLDTVNLEDIAKEYPARKARYALALERFKNVLSKKRLEQKILYYELYKTIKKEAVEKGYKLTEEHLKALIITNEKYQRISQEIVDLESKVNILTACKEALEDQGRMIYLLCSNVERNF